MFVPKKYLEGNIDDANCKHELLKVNFDSWGEIYRDDYTCLICGHVIHNNIYRREIELKDRFVYKEFINEQENIRLIKFMLKYIAKRYENEDSIDIVNIFRNIYPEIEKISGALNTQTEKEKKISFKSF